MSNAARKARKSAGVQFVHPTKAGTPLQSRAAFEFLQPVKAAALLLLRGESPEVAEAARKDLTAARDFRAKQRRLAGRH